MKKIVLFILVLSLAMGMCLPAAAAYTQFPDVTDTAMQRDVDVLRMMGVVEGDNTGYFRPNNNLTRAEFCKMAVEVMGKGDEESIYRNRTIFPDVKSTHWARGYINLAVSEKNKIIIGNGDGTFRPDDSITFAQSVTMLMRMLGYADADAGMLWPQGYMELAAECGLTEGINISANTAITRAQAAKLFGNLLATNIKGTESEYVSNLGTVIRDVIIMSDNATADNGKPGAIATSSGNYLPKNGIVPSSFVGLRGILVSDGDGYALTFIPDSGSTTSIVVDSAQAGSLKASNGTTYTIPSGTAAYTTEDTSTYGKLWMDIKKGTRVNIYFTAGGKVDGVFVNSGSYDEAMVAYTSVSGNPFISLVNGDTGYRIFKNGIEAKASDIRQYDVATYDKSSKTLHISDLRITGMYEDVYPNRESASTVTLMGKEFTVLSSATEALSKFNIGDSITLLLTSDLKVAGAVNSSAARGNAVGIVTECSETSATVELFMGITVSGNPNLSDTRAQELSGQLVTVASSGNGKISISKLTGSGASGDLNINNKTVGSLKLSDDVKFFEKVGSSEMRQIDVDDILQSTVPASKIAYVAKDYAGRANIIVLNDVTGDMYTYGIVTTGTISSGPSDLTATNRTVSVKNRVTDTGAVIYNGGDVTNNSFIGLVKALDGVRAAAVKKLESISGVKRSAFTSGDTVTVTTSKGTFVVADDVACYNNVTKQWFKTLDEARSFSDNLTLYYDELPAQGGKVRIVVAN